MIAQDRFIVVGGGHKLDNGGQGHIGRNLNWDKLTNGFTLTDTQRAYCSTAGGVVFASLKQPLTPDYDVGGTFLPVGTPTGKSARLCGRMDPAHANPQDQTFYGLEYDVASGSYRLIRRVTGTDAAPIATAAQALTTATPAFLRMRGNVIEGWVNDSLLLSATDSTITGAGSFGLYCAAVQDPNNAIVLDGTQLGFWATNAWEADAPWADRFDDLQAKALENHRSDSNASYAQHPLHLGKSAEIRHTLNAGTKCSSFGGVVRMIDAGAYYLSSDTIPNDFDCDLVFDALASPLTSLYFTFRASRTTDDYYYVGYNKNGQLEIGKVVAGARSVLGAYVTTPTGNDRYLGELSVRGSNFVLKWKGVERINVTDSQFASGAAGIWTDQATTDTSKGMRLQNIYVRAPLSAPSNVVYFDGSGLTAWGNYPPNDYDANSLFWGRVKPFGTRQTMTGVGGRYQSVTADPLNTPHGSGSSIRYERRSGDWAYAREKAMNKVRTTLCMGMEDWDLYIGFRLYVPGNQEIASGTVLGQQSSQEIWSTHQNQLVPPVDDPGIETTSLKIANAITWKLNGRGGWEDQIGGQVYASVYDGQTLGNIVFNAWNDFVFHLFHSSDPGVGRVDAWFSGGGAWASTDKRFGPYPASTMDYARSNYEEVGWYCTPRGLRLPNVVELFGFKVGNTFAAVDPKP